MTKALFVVFLALTVGAAYLTFFDVGVAETRIDRSVRQGSAGLGPYRHTGK